MAALVHAHYERGRTIRLVDHEGEREVDYPDCFFVRSRDAARLPHSWRDFVAPDRGGFSRVAWPEGSKGSRAARLQYFKDAVFTPRAIEPLEADVSPVQRFLVEHPEIELARDLRLLFVDLETERVEDWDRPWRSRILSFSWKRSDGRGGHVRVAAQSDLAERELLRTLARLIDRHDVVLAWNGDRFDFPVIKSRMALLEIPFDPDLVHWIDHLALFKRYYQHSEDGSVTSSFKLEAIGQAFLGEGKVPIERVAKERGWDGRGDMFAWTWANIPEVHREYNDQDVELMVRLEERTGFIALHQGICRLCRVLPGARSLYPMSLVDGRMLQRGYEAGYHFPSRFHEEEKRLFQKARGAYVPEAVVGVHESVAVLDYAKMYVSIICTWNMSLETLDPAGDLAVPDTDERGHRTGGTIARFRSGTEGHLPAALRGVIALRKQYAKLKEAAEVGSVAFHDAGRLSDACKVLGNTFYGVILSPYSRFYMQEIGEAITSVGRLLLSTTLRQADARRLSFVFGDTDSNAIKSGDEEARALKAAMNGEVIPELVAGCGVPRERNEVAIDYEKRYARVIVTASKRYAGRYALYKGKPAAPDAPIDVRGLEIVRSDVCRAARVLQKRAILAILEPETVPEARELRGLVLGARKEFWENGAPVEDLVIAKGMAKSIADYASKPVHVKVAERMIESGAEFGVGSKVPFLLVEGGKVLHPDEMGDGAEIDRVAYWNKYVYPPTERVLEACYPGAGWEQLHLNPKSWIRGQFDLGLVERPVRKVAARRPTRAVRKPAPPEIVVLTFREESVGSAVRIRELLEAFPGECAVRVVVQVRDGERVDVELDCPQRIADPASSPALARALAAVGASWVPVGG